MSFAAKIDVDIQNILNNVEPFNTHVTTNQTNVKGILNSKNNFNNNIITSDSDSSSSSVVHDFNDDDVVDDDVHDENDDNDENDDDDDDNDYDIDDDATDDSDTSSQFAEKNNGKDNNNKNTNKDAQQFLSITDKKEQARLKISKFLFIGSILLVGVIVCAITYWILNKNATADTEESFTVFCNAIEDQLKFQVKNIFEANRALSRAISVSSKSNNQTFPYVLLSGFEAYAYDARKKGRFSEIMYTPVVKDESIWLNFTTKNRGWYIQSKEIYDALEPGKNRSAETKKFPNYNKLHIVNELGFVVKIENDSTSTQRSLIYPTLYTSPPPSLNATTFQNVDLSSVASFKSVSLASLTLKDAVFSPFGTSFSVMTGIPINEVLVGRNPQSIAAQPIFATLQQSSNDIVGFLFTLVGWEKFLVNLLPTGVNGISAVLRNSCGQAISYTLNGGDAIFINASDIHDTKYDNSKRTFGFDDNYISSSDILRDVIGHCYIFVDLYPTSTFEESSSSSLPIILTCVIGAIFVGTILVFLFYDYMVENRDRKVIRIASKANAFIVSLYPQNVAQRLLLDKEKSSKERMNSKMNRGNGDGEIRQTTLRGFLNNGEKNASLYNAQTSGHNGEFYTTKPIADLFPECTVMFADIVGFTAWSSSREPTLVFVLLETIYHAFDYIALRRRVFKVETIGDCYVAVCGLPDPRKDHALVMARFARDCMNQMSSLTKRLENTLGPDTSDLAMRVGLHSGPVIGGVLRGEKARFQLFGDTMNTASRIESTGGARRIHISQETAELIIDAGKTSWLTQRQDKVHAKGKGLINTYWLELESGGTNRSSSGMDSSHHTYQISNSEEPDNCIPDEVEFDSKTRRLINWNCEVLQRILKQIIQRRESSGKKKSQNFDAIESYQPSEGKMVIDEVKEIITLPLFDPAASHSTRESVELDESVWQQLQMYVAEIAALYRDNPFHNFEHASHVTMSVVKLLSRIVAPSEADFLRMEVSNELYSLHDHTYGITSDPLTQFACVLSALIHDLDHPGVPNSQLVNENHPLASRFNNKSVAEQNSVDLAWGILSNDKYKDLRAAIYSDEVELVRFRSLVVNSVMATDIIDKDLKDLRNARWDKAFKKSPSSSFAEDEHVAVNRKATIVIEHLIQASDVVHTMQHWHVYRKWNEMFFEECYRAYKSGRASVDPATSWYKGEIGFYDFYIIPLAKKLKDCGVFGVSSDEYLNYALKNRAEWEIRGLEIVNEMIERVSNEEEN